MDYIPRLYDFLERLRDNNDRAWFHEHKDEYDELRALWLADIDRVISAMTPWEPGMATQTARSSAYRIYRDTRFSRDKTPFKTYFSAALSPWGRKSDRAGYYIEMGPDGYGAGLYGGIWCPDSPTLKKLRKAIIDNIEEWDEIMAEPRMRELFPEMTHYDDLKTVPQGWPKDHPRAELLRLKQYGKWHAAGPDFYADPAWPEKVADHFRVLKPFIDFLNYSIDEEV